MRKNILINCENHELKFSLKIYRQTSKLLHKEFKSLHLNIKYRAFIGFHQKYCKIHKFIRKKFWIGKYRNNIGTRNIGLIRRLVVDLNHTHNIKIIPLDRIFRIITNVTYILLNYLDLIVFSANKLIKMPCSKPPLNP